MNEFAKVSQETLDLVKTQLTKGITTATGLMGYSLEAPSKHLVPFLSPLRNRIPRVLSKTGTAVHWKAITDIKANGKATTTEGVRGNTVTYSTKDCLAAFKTFGLQDFVTLEAIAAGRNFEDVKAVSVTNLLLKVMVEEEKLILGGNSTSLGVVAQPVASFSASGGALAAGDYSVKVAALTLTAANKVSLNSQVANLVLDASDGVTLPSAAKAFTATGSAGSVAISVTPVKGAFAYAIFVGAAGAETLQLVSSVSQVTLTSLVAGGTAATAVTADTSGDALAFDGIIPQTLANGGYFIDKGATTLTKANGGVKEFDDINSYMFNKYKIGITRWLVSEQVARDLTSCIIEGAGAPMLLVNNAEKDNITANYMVTQYINKSYGGQKQIIEVHPWLPQGSFLGITESIPYPNANIPAVLEVECGYDYTQLEYAQVNPQYEYEVRAFEALKHYFPAGCAFVCNVLPM